MSYVHSLRSQRRVAGRPAFVVPIVSINAPNAGIQQPVTITSTTPVHSSYTGNLIGYGNIPVGTRCDALPSQRNYGRDYHVIVHNPANGSYMAHYNTNIFFR